MKLFYMLWADCISRARLQPTNKHNWKTMTLIIMSLAMSSNFVVIMALLQREILKYDFYKFDITFLSGPIKNVVRFIVLFYLPCIVFNYLMIFRKNQYDNLLRKYKYHNGVLFLSYFLISIFTPILLMWVGVLLSLV